MGRVRNRTREVGAILKRETTDKAAQFEYQTKQRKAITVYDLRSTS